MNFSWIFNRSWEWKFHDLNLSNSSLTVEVNHAQLTYLINIAWSTPSIFFSNHTVYSHYGAQVIRFNKRFPIQFKNIDLEIAGDVIFSNLFINHLDWMI